VLRSDGCQLRRLRDLYVRFGDLSQQDYEQERDNLLALRAEIEVRQEPRVASSLPIDGRSRAFRQAMLRPPIVATSWATAN